MTSPPFMIQRVLAAAGLITAFVFMASVFSPSPTRAGQGTPAVEILSPAMTSAGKTTAAPIEGSTNPHSGLASLGEIQTNAYLVRIYSTELGPRYTITDRAESKEVATLMSAADVSKFFPELPLSEIQFGTDERSEAGTDNANSGPLMLADTPGASGSEF